MRGGLSDRHDVRHHNRAVKSANAVRRSASVCSSGLPNDAGYFGHVCKASGSTCAAQPVTTIVHGPPFMCLTDCLAGLPDSFIGDRAAVYDDDIVVARQAVLPMHCFRQD